MPRRLQQRRSKGWHKPVGSVIVSRPSKWGNPFKIDEHHTRADVVKLFRDWIGSDDPRAVKMRYEIGELRGKDLLCWCAEGEPCHGDVLIELANGASIHVV
jgi:hypothetical protein